MIPDSSFLAIESDIGSVVEQLVPPELLDRFTEFHAYQLYRANPNDGGVFVDIDEQHRYDAIRRLLGILPTYNLPFIYSAVNKRRLASGPLSRVNPLDVAFRLCLMGVEKWLDKREMHREEFWEDLCLFIVDDCDKSTRAIFRETFRAMRLRLRDSQLGLGLERVRANKLWHAHDAMYFGDSKDSVGLQVADLCSYFMMRKLRGEYDGEFFDILARQAIYAEPEPDLLQSSPWLLRHDA